MFTSHNYIQIKCHECNVTSHFQPGEYSTIECPKCKKEQKNAKKSKRSTSTNKKI